MGNKSEFEKAIRRANRNFDLMNQGKNPTSIVVEDLGHGHKLIKVVNNYPDEEEEKSVAENTQSPIECPTEIELISQRKHPFRGTILPNVLPHTGGAIMAEKQEKNGLVRKIKRTVGVSSTCGILGYFLIPLIPVVTIPATVAIVAGMAVGALVAKATNKN